MARALFSALQNPLADILGVALAAALLALPTHAAGDELRVLEGDVRWSGDVLVDGVVVVPEGSGLTIEAGAKVRFARRDEDGDGIGDGELRVEGGLFVEGAPDRPVVFTSASPDPRAADWKYVMINHAREAVVRHAVFEYAYSGVQIHYTRGRFTGILSRHNVDGFRFSTAPVTLTESVLSGNENGIRFEERGAGARIEGNLVTGNRVGIFAVVKCRGLTSFTDNAFEGNRDYNVKLGQEQAEDFPVAGNWWGTADPAAAARTFFDGRTERGLGSVLFEPFLAARPALLVPRIDSATSPEGR